MNVANPFLDRDRQLGDVTPVPRGAIAQDADSIRPGIDGRIDAGLLCIAFRRAKGPPGTAAMARTCE